MLKKLRTKFICITMAIVTIMLGVVFVLVYHFTSRNLEQDSLEMMKKVTSGGPSKGHPGGKDESIQSPYFILAVSKDGKISVREKGNFDLSDEAFLAELVNTALSEEEEFGNLREYGLRFSRMDTHKEQLLVFADTSRDVNILRDMIFTSLLIGVCSLVGFFLLSLFLARWAIGPVEKAWQQQKQFVADASHELKTPLTVILTNAALLQNPQCDETAQRQSTNSILDMSCQMRGLVENLLKLARVDDSSTETKPAKLNLSELVSDALLPFDPVFFEQSLTLESEISPNITIKGREDQLKQLVEILLDNAQKYSHPQSTVLVELERGGNHCFLRVTNQGDEISGEDLKNIFKRFYRVDKVRSMNHSYGLGLSIALGIVENHKGKIWAESNGGRNVFTVQLPIE